MTHNLRNRTPTVMRLGYRELVTPSMIGLTASVAITLMAVVAMLGPLYGLQTLTLTQRLAYYGVLTAFEVPICFACGFFTLFVMRHRSPIQIALGLAVMCLIVVAPGVGFSVVLYAAFHGGEVQQFNYIGDFLFAIVTFGGGIGLVFYVLCMRLRRTSERSGSRLSASESSHTGLDSAQDTSALTSATASSPSEADAASQPSSLAADIEPVPGLPNATEAAGAISPQVDTRHLRLLDKKRETIVYVHVSGHYVEIVTTSGTEVLLMRLSDVAKALEGQGMQTHRSYWAAYRHILRMEKYERRAVLHLTGEHKVPVSRSFRGEVGAFMKERERPSQ